MGLSPMTSPPTAYNFLFPLYDYFQILQSVTPYHIYGL